MTEALDRRIGQVHSRIDAHEQRLQATDKRLTQLEIDSAGHALRSQHIDARLSEIQSGITWITRLVLAGIIGGIVAFIIQGGLNVS